MSNYGYPSSADRRDTQPRGRICSTEGCDTVLSRYNRTDQCGLHAHQTKLSSRAARGGVVGRGRNARAVDRGS
jgi:hypothetical protein